MFLPVEILTRIIKISVLLLFTYFITYSSIKKWLIQILIYDLISISVVENGCQIGKVEAIRNL